MNELPSTIFRNTFNKITEPTTVTVNGRLLGVWTPATIYVEIGTPGRPDLTDLGRGADLVVGSVDYRPVPKPGSKR